MKKSLKIFLVSFIATALVVVAIKPFSSTNGKVKSYYSGDTIAYNGYIVIATTNTGQLELFKLTSDHPAISKFATLTSYNARFSTPQNYVDVLLRQENDSLYAYAVNGRSIYKYDISDLQHARFIKEVQDGGWDWLGSLQVIDNHVATNGSRGVKIWNNDLIVIDGYTIVNPGDKIYNTTTGDNDRYVFSLYEGKIKVFDREERAVRTAIPLDLKWGSDWYKRQVYSQGKDTSLYVVDDEEIRHINFNGEVINSFDHTGSLGYDVIPSENRDFIYFSDGIGVVKLRASNLEVISYAYTIHLATDNGWAMGMKTVNDGNGEKVVVFNGGNILVLDSNLKPLKEKGEPTFVIATQEDTYPDVIEPLGLSVDKNRAAAGSEVVLNGQGFGANEEVEITFLDNKTEAWADDFGRFSTKLTVPTALHKRTDIQVVGQVTNFKYSLGFEIE